MPGATTVDRSVMWVSLLASGIPCCVLLVSGIALGWPAAHAVAYSSLVLLYLGLKLTLDLPSRLSRWFWQRLWLFLLLMGGLSLGIQALSFESFLQPIIFTIPMIYPAFVYPMERVALVGVFYLVLMNLGIALGIHELHYFDFIFPTIGYGVLMLFMYAFTRLSVNQARARARADTLAADLAEQRDELARLYEQAGLSATLSERNRLARELHDTIAQGLTAVTMQLEAAQRSFDRDPVRTRARIERAHELARQTLDDVRRSVWTLASPLIDGNTLTDTLKETSERFCERTGIAAYYQHSGPLPTLDSAAASQVIRIVQEALQNVEKHSTATQVNIISDTTSTGLTVSVQDNGIGFDPDALTPSTAGGFGLVSLAERARLAGGRLQVESTPGSGALLTVTIDGVK